MIPAWVRRLTFAAVLVQGTLMVSAVAHPDACTDVWAWEYYRSGCCDLSAYTRWTDEGGDCCDYGSVEDREPGGFASATSIGPAPFVHLPPPAEVAPPATTEGLRTDDSIPERPPDRAHRTTVLLI